MAEGFGEIFFRVKKKTIFHASNGDSSIGNSNGNNNSINSSGSSSSIKAGRVGGGADASFSWRPEALKTSLTFLSAESGEVDEALSCFRSVLGFMGDRKTSRGVIEHAAKIVAIALVGSTELRDEVLVQICRYVSQLPDYLLSDVKTVTN